MKFDIDQNGILNVSAKDLGSGKQASVKIEQSSGLSKDEIERMRRDAEVNADEDRRQFELAEARNKGDNLIYQLEKLIKEQAEKLTEADRMPLEKAIAKLRETLTTSDTEKIRAATSELEQASQAFSKILYEKSNTEKEGASPAPASGEDDAIDAEFEVKE